MNEQTYVFSGRSAQRFAGKSQLDDSWAVESSGMAVVDVELAYHNACQGNLTQIQSLEVACYASPREIARIRAKPRGDPRGR